MTDSRPCTKCKQIKFFTAFGKNKTKPLGIDNECLPCRRVSRAEYRLRNAESIAKQQAANYQRNRKKRIAYATARVYANMERHKQYNAISKKRNHLSVAADTRRRNARRKANGIFAISKKELKRLSQRPCFYCGATERLTVDHVVAIARGGTDSIGNLVSACKTCNSQKRDLTIMEWRKKRESR
jgi:5-methylcytosine-specific restriction endonuclease McrA